MAEIVVARLFNPSTGEHLTVNASDVGEYPGYQELTPSQFEELLATRAEEARQNEDVTGSSEDEKAETPLTAEDVIHGPAGDVIGFAESSEDIEFLLQLLELEQANRNRKTVVGAIRSQLTDLGWKEPEPSEEPEPAPAETPEEEEK